MQGHAWPGGRCRGRAKDAGSPSPGPTPPDVGGSPEARAQRMLCYARQQGQGPGARGHRLNASVRARARKKLPLPSEPSPSWPMAQLAASRVQRPSGPSQGILDMATEGANVPDTTPTPKYPRPQGAQGRPPPRNGQESQGQQGPDTVSLILAHSLTSGIASLLALLHCSCTRA